MTTIGHRTLKVCKIDSITFASFAIKQKVDFLGIHVLERNDIGVHYELCEFIKSNSGRPVIVTKINDLQTLQQLIKQYRPAGIQFHFEIDPQLVLAIRNLFPNLLLFGVLTDQSKFLDFDTARDLFDFLIYDTSYIGGTSESNSFVFFDKFQKSLKEKTLLAGGITTNRLLELDSMNAGGYDVQSYFRKQGGLSFKNLNNICDLLKFPRRNMLSVSLTDIPLKTIQHSASFHLYANLEYHLDISQGSLYPSFNTVAKSIEEKLQYLNSTPCSIHLFKANENEIQEEIKKITQKYPLNITRIFVQYFQDINLDVFKERIGDLRIIPSIFFKDIDSYCSRLSDSKVLSIVVPTPESSEDIELFVRTFLDHRKYFESKEIWFDRNLDLAYIQFLIEKLGKGFNFIVGKGVINDWQKIDSIKEHLLR
ncbi:MAG TPA: hypothetical protein VK590_15290 [Saprospiraceae bacterium]|nr:hypothetical protein [Saprospiraceae bacterium]